MGNFITIILAVLILIYTIYQVIRLIKATRKGKCIGCPSADECDTQYSEDSVVQIQDLTKSNKNGLD